MSQPSATRSAATTLPDHPAVGRPGRLRRAVFNFLSSIALRLLPHIPHVVKRLLLTGRSVTVDGNTLDTTMQLMLALNRVVGGAGLVWSNDIGVARSQLRTLAGFLDAPITVAVHDLAMAGAVGERPARHYAPSGDDGPDDGPHPLLVFFHGGGFVLGGIDTHDALCRLLCRDAAVHVLSVDYRLAPEHPALAAVNDAYAAYRWATEHAASLGADPDRIAVGGDSAGGNLAAVVAHEARAANVPPPALQFLLYPVTDSLSGDATRSVELFADGFFLTASDIEWCRARYVGGATAAPGDPRISPLRAGDFAGLPPTLIATGGFDPLRDEGRRYAEALTAGGVVVDHRHFGTLIHGFANFFPLGGDSATAMAELVSALRAHLTRG